VIAALPSPGQEMKHAEEKEGMKAYSEVITAEAKTDSGLNSDIVDPLPREKELRLHSGITVRRLCQ
jgi:hypothetical protein